MLALQLTAIFLLPAVSPAGDICAPLSELHSSIDFCEQNPQYVPPAKACRDQYKALVAAKEAQVQRELAAQASAGGDDAQNLKFGTTKTVYQTTDNELTNLINTGTKVIGEIEAYSDDFVPPIPSWAAGYFKPDWRNPGDRARKLEFYCYAEPIKDMDLVLGEMHMLVDQLSITRDKTRQLHGITGVRDNKLGILADNGGLGAKKRGIGNGEAENVASTITGQPTKDKLENSGNTVKLGAAPLPPAASRAIAGTVTGTSDRAKWQESYSSALHGRDGKLVGLDGKVGSELRLPSIDDAKLDTQARSASPMAGAAETVLDQLGTAVAKPAAEEKLLGEGRALASLEPVANSQAESGVTPKEEGALTLATDAAVSAAPEAKGSSDLRDLFQRTHSAYVRSQKRNRI